MASPGFVIGLIGNTIRIALKLIQENKHAFRDLADLELTARAVEQALEPLKTKDAKKLDDGYKFVLESLQQCLEVITHTLQELNESACKASWFSIQVSVTSNNNHIGIHTILHCYTKRAITYDSACSDDVILSEKLENLAYVTLSLFHSSDISVSPSSLRVMSFLISSVIIAS
jgi:hypothetical protein